MKGGFFYFLFARIHFRTYQPKTPPPTKYGIPTARPITVNTARKTMAQTTMQSSGIYRKHLSFMIIWPRWMGRQNAHPCLLSYLSALDNTVTNRYGIFAVSTLTFCFFVFLNLSSPTCHRYPVVSTGYAFCPILRASKTVPRWGVVSTLHDVSPIFLTSGAFPKDGVPFWYPMPLVLSV